MDNMKNVVSVRRRALNICYRGVLGSLLGRRLNLHDKGDVERGYLRVVALWHRQLVRMQKHTDWPTLKSPLRFTWAANCPQTLVNLADNAWSRKPCHLPICPWCWCRHIVRSTYQRLSAVVATLSEPYDLIDLRRSDTRIGRLEPEVAYRPSLDGTGRYELQATGRSVNGAVRETAASMRGAFEQKRLLGVEGAVVLVSIEPGFADPQLWTFRVRQLLLIPRAKPYTPPQEAAFIRQPANNRILLLRAVARFARFPSGLLFGDPNEVWRVLQAHKGYRLFRSYGICRGNQS